MTDLKQLPGPPDHPARAARCKDNRRRRAVAQPAARQQLRRLLPQAARLPVIPVNPRESEILGERATRACATFPGCGSRRRGRVPRAGRAAGHRPRGGRDRGRSALVPVRRDQRRGHAIAEEGGLDVVMDRCLKIEHARYVGRMHWLGFNTQRITSVHAGLRYTYPHHTDCQPRNRTDRQVTQPSSFSYSVRSTATTRSPRAANSSAVRGALVRHQDASARRAAPRGSRAPPGRRGSSAIRVGSSTSGG